MIYVPINDLDNYCVIVEDKDTIRAINKEEISGTYEYTDFYVNSHYLYKKSYTTFLPSECLTDVSNSWYYRNDVSDIFLMCFIGALFFVGIPLVIFSRMFPRFKR